MPLGKVLSCSQRCNQANLQRVLTCLQGSYHAPRGPYLALKRFYHALRGSYYAFIGLLSCSQRVLPCYQRVLPCSQSVLLCSQEVSTIFSTILSFKKKSKNVQNFCPYMSPLVPICPHLSPISCPLSHEMPKGTGTNGDMITP